MEIEAVAADGKVKVVLNGQQTPQRVEIDVEGLDVVVSLCRTRPALQRWCD